MAFYETLRFNIVFATSRHMLWARWIREEKDPSFAAGDRMPAAQPGDRHLTYVQNSIEFYSHHL
jgi:hypothetical protein